MIIAQRYTLFYILVMKNIGINLELFRLHLFAADYNPQQT